MIALTDRNKPFDMDLFTTLMHNPRMYWRKAARYAEEAIAIYCGCDPRGVLVTDRCSNALRLAYKMFNPLVQRVYTTHRTYAATYEVPAQEKFMITCTPSLIPWGDELKRLGRIYSPVVLGGNIIDIQWFKFPNLVYDCAQTFYRNMLKDIHFGLGQFVAISFQAYKPFGFMGGGALIGNPRSIEMLRRMGWPDRQHKQDVCADPQLSEAIAIYLAVSQAINILDPYYKKNRDEIFRPLCDMLIKNGIAVTNNWAINPSMILIDCEKDQNVNTMRVRDVKKNLQEHGVGCGNFYGYFCLPCYDRKVLDYVFEGLY